MSEELKLCPFCNREAQRTESSRLISCAFDECPAFLLAVPADNWNLRAQPAEAEGVVTKIECTTCRGTGSLEFEGGAVVKDCAPCKGTGRDLQAERYALAARLSEAITALSAVTAERDRLRAFMERVEKHAEYWWDAPYAEVVVGIVQEWRETKAAAMAAKEE